MAAPQVKSVIRHFDDAIEAKLKEARELTGYWGNLYGYEKNEIIGFTQKISSPRTTNNIYRGAAQRLVGEIRMSVREKISESSDQKAIARFCFIKESVHNLLDILEKFDKGGTSGLDGEGQKAVQDLIQK